MAKGRSIHLGSKNFFTLVVLSVGALGVMLFTYASQQQTQTQSSAAGTITPTPAPGDCRVKPNFSYDGANSNPDNVVYKFTATNRNSTACDSKFRKQAYVIEVLNAPGRNWTFRDSVKTSYSPFTKWTTEPFQETYNVSDYTLKRFSWASAGTNSTQNDYTRTREYRLRVIPPSGASKGRHSFKVQLCQVIPTNGYDRNLQLSGWSKVFDNCTTRDLTYVKD